MWHEARRQERKIRGMLVDYRRRAERRRDFYERIKADPTQFLQVHGRQCRIHLDPAIAAAADSSSAMMPWQGQSDNLIDRFDVRAHLDHIPDLAAGQTQPDEQTALDRQINYEAYRIIAQNSFLAVPEEKFLKQLHLEEQFGYTEQLHKAKKDPKAAGAAIGYTYEDSSPPPEPAAPAESDAATSDSDVDVDLALNVAQIEPAQAHELNRHGRGFGMRSNDFYSFLTGDLEEAERLRLAREEEHEKALFSGRKSRRERRAHRERRLANRVISPPSYAAVDETVVVREAVSRSPSPEVSGKITYITSFGDEEEPAGTSTERRVYVDRRRRSRDRRRRRSRSRSRSRSKNAKSHRHRRSRSRGRYRRNRSTSSSDSSAIVTKSPEAVRKNKSKSPQFAESPPKVVGRYYGRKKSDQSSSELSESSPNDKEGVSPVNSDKWPGSGNTVNVIKKSGQNPILDRLKRKRQALLNKQFKADKIAEQIKTEREKQEQQHREDELREIAIKLRRRQREKRHAYDSNRSSSTSDSSSSKSPSPVSVEKKPKSKSRSPVRREDSRRRHSRDRREHSRERRGSKSPKRHSERKYSRYSRRHDERDYRKDNRKEERPGRSLVDY